MPRRSSRDKEKEVEKAFRTAFPKADIEVYTHRGWAIRIKIVDPKFRGMGRIEREELAFPVLEKLKPGVVECVTMLLLRAPREEKGILDLEFEDPIEAA